jgi:glutathione peroxidase
MKKLLTILWLSATFTAGAQNLKDLKAAADSAKDERISIYKYNYTLTDIDGKKFEWNQLKGKKIMIVNTASKDAGTPQLGPLQQLYKKYRDKNFVVVVFPANDYGKEPAENPEIKKFYEQSYGATFYMMSKSNCTGPKANPVFTFVSSKTLNGSADNKLESNFYRILLDEQGRIDAVYPPKKNLNSQDILRWIEDREE